MCLYQGFAAQPATSSPCLEACTVSLCMQWPTGTAAEQSKGGSSGCTFSIRLDLNGLDPLAVVGHPTSALSLAVCRACWGRRAGGDSLSVGQEQGIALLCCTQTACNSGWVARPHVFGPDCAAWKAASRFCVSSTLCTAQAPRLVHAFDAVPP